MTSTTTAQITTTRVGPMDNGSYLISAEGDALLIDAAAKADRLLAVADDLDVRITDVLTTHRHHDHVGALPDVLSATGARHHASVQDAPGLPSAVDQTWGDHPDIDKPRNLEFSSDALNRLGLQYVLLRGHTEGGLAVILSPTNAQDGRPHLFSGDSLFPGGVGKTDDAEAFNQLLDDVTARCFVLPDETVIHPGHGDASRIGAERPHLAEWRERGW